MIPANAWTHSPNDPSLITPLKSHQVQIYAKHTHKQFGFKTQAGNVCTWLHSIGQSV